MGTRMGGHGFGASSRGRAERAGGGRVGAVLLLSLTFLGASASSAWGVNEFSVGYRWLSSADLMA